MPIGSYHRAVVLERAKVLLGCGISVAFLQPIDAKDWRVTNVLTFGLILRINSHRNGYGAPPIPGGSADSAVVADHRGQRYPDAAAPFQKRQLNDTGGANDGAALPLHQLDCGLHGAASGDQVVQHEDAPPR